MTSDEFLNQVCYYSEMPIIRIWERDGCAFAEQLLYIPYESDQPFELFIMVEPGVETSLWLGDKVVE